MQPATLHYRSLQRLRHQALAQGGYDCQIHLSQEAKIDLQCWSDNLTKWNRMCLRRLPLNLEIETDASQRGWGAYSDGILTGGFWNGMEAALHSDAQELLAALYGIKAFAQRRTKLHIVLLTDNITIVAYVNHLGGTKSKILVTIVKDNHHSPASTWTGERQSKLHVKAPLRSDRLDVKSTHLQCFESEVGPIQNRPVCYQADKATTNVLQLETRSRVSRSRCTGPRLEPSERVCQSPMVSHRKDTSQSLSSESHSDTNHSSLAKSAQVTNSVVTASGLPTPSPGATDHHPTTELQGHNTTLLSSASRVGMEPLCISELTQDASLCPVKCLNEYVARTQTWRKQQS